MVDRTRFTILVVDDQPINIQTLVQLLRLDYRILVANNGAKAIKIAQGEDQPDLILLDINMPTLNGYEVCRRLKSSDKSKKIPIIFVTARDTPEDEVRGFDVGASDYISKPFQPTIVRARVRTHINLKIRTDAFERLALLDGLTGIHNRYYYEEHRQKIWKYCIRKKIPLSVVMIDIDYFKNYNDHYGHGAGDEALRKVARALRRTVHRPMDMIARYGGEEFILLLPETDLDGVIYLVNQMLAAIRDLQILHEFSAIADYLTVSIGYGTVSKFEGSTPSEAVQKADDALYKAKDLGRNRGHRFNIY